MTSRITTSIKIDDMLWRAAKKKAIDSGIKTAEYLETLIRKDIGGDINATESIRTNDKPENETD